MVDFPSSSNVSTSVSMINQIIEVIEVEKQKVHKLRTQMGLHRLETDKTRFERWEITAAKLYALDAVRSSIGALQFLAQDLTGKKTSLPLSALVNERDSLLSLGLDDTRRGMFESGASKRSQAAVLSRLIDQFSGNAEEQPLTSEKPLEPGPCLEVPTASLPAGLACIPDSFYAGQSVEMLRFYAEKMLDELESRNCGDSWALVHSGVGEGDDLVPYQINN